MEADHFRLSQSQPEEREALLRTLRFATIQLHKFWVEIQSFPAFMGALDDASVQDVEALFEWLRSSPNWVALVESPELITALLEPSTRASLLEFRRDVKCVRAIRAEASERVVPEALASPRFKDELWRLRRCADVMRRRPGVAEYARTEVTERLEKARSELARLRVVIAFFARLHRELGIPLPAKASEAEAVFRYLECVNQAPPEVASWRLPQILHPSNKIRIETWAERARPLLEQGAEIEKKFVAPAGADPSVLRAVAERLRAGGWFKRFKAGYRQAIQDYRALLTEQAGGGVRSKNAPEPQIQMADSLDLWARWIEQSTTFAKNAEGQAIFGSNFRGARTDFASANRTHAWAQEMRVALAPSESRFRQTLLDHLFKTDAKPFEASRGIARSPEQGEAGGILQGPEFKADGEFSVLESKLVSWIQDLERVQSAIEGLNLKSGHSAGGLLEVLERFEEIEFLVRRMDTQPLPRQILGAAFMGAETRLDPLEQALSYVRSVETAALPEKLKKLLLASQGPLRLQENRKLVAPAMHSLGLVKEHLAKVEAASRGRFLAGEAGPIPGLVAAFGEVLKRPLQHGNA